MKKLMRKSLMNFACLPAVAALLAVPAPSLAKSVHIVGDEVVTSDTSDHGGRPADIDGPLNDNISDSGVLFGDLYRIARYKGGEIKKVPAVDASGNPVYEQITWTDPEGTNHLISVQKLTDKQTVDGVEEDVIAVGGEPILTEDYACVLADEEITEETDMIVVTNPVSGNQYIVSPYPSQCVQPVADPEYWGLIPNEEFVDNLIPLIKTYDSTWQRTECEVDPEAVFLEEDEVFQSYFLDENGTEILEYVFDLDDHHAAIYYTDLVQEVEFGRLNLARAPQAVLDASFDEAIRSLNAATDIMIDASGRLMVTTDIYDEFLTDADGEPLWLESVTKAIDSPKENLALYVKLLKDGHLITPAVERAPIDYSIYGGMPINQLLELEDGPSDAPRPTIDIQKMRDFGLGHLVDPGVTYDESGILIDNEIVTYYIRMEEDGSLYLSEDEENLGEMVIYEGSCPSDVTCVEYVGLVEPLASSACSGDDFPVAASFFAAAADKKGHITVDKIVYINSILGINKVVGKEYDEYGNLIANYAKNPVYFNFNITPEYDRLGTYGVPDINGVCNTHRGRVQYRDGDGSYVYDGMVEFLEETDPGSKIWVETPDYIVDRVFHVNVDDPLNIVDDDPPQTIDIGGFNSMADDDLQVIKFTHTYQIPGLR